MQPRSNLTSPPLRSRLPRIGFGAASLGNLYAPLSDDEAMAVIDAMWTAGVRLYDTAPLYGGGLSEVRVGKGLAGRPRSDYILCTKVGRGRPFGQRRAPDGSGDFWNFSYDFTLQSVAESLTRLRTDRLDVVHIHDPDQQLEEAIRGAYRSLVRLQAEGVIGSIGVGSNSEVALTEMARRGIFECFLLAGRYTLLEQKALPVLLPLCSERDIAVLAGGVFNSGILATGPGPGARYDYWEATGEVQSRVRQLSDVCREHQVPVKAAALQFPTGHPAVKTVLLGGRSVAHLQEDLQLMNHPIPESFWQDLHARQLVDPAAPVPGAR